MKKLYTLFLCLTICESLPAQNACSNAALIGYTNIPDQSNDGCTGRLLYEWPDQTMSAVWMMSMQNAPYTDRGTGYNFFNGSWNSPPSTRLESVRTGFPNITGGGNGEELIFCHTTQNALINFRSQHGTGPWVENPIQTIPLIWNKSVRGGIPGQLHLIGNEQYLGNSLIYPMRYWRSPDNGVTWDIQNYLIPFLDSSFTFCRVPSKSIACRGNVVAIVTGGWSENLVLSKSTDSGITWYKTEVSNFPINKYDELTMITDINNDGVADTVVTVDGSHSIVIDSNNNVHVWAGRTKVWDVDSVGLMAFFPTEDGLVYWNETMPANSILSNVIADAEDLNSDGTITFSQDFNFIQCGATSMTSAGINTLNHLFVTYSALMEDTLIPSPIPNYSARNLYAIKSIDNGLTWSTPYRICPDDYADQIYPSMAELVYDDPKIIFIRDSAATAFPFTTKEVKFISPDLATNTIHIESENILFNAWQSSNLQNVVIDLNSNVKLINPMIEVFDLSGRLLHVHKILNPNLHINESIQLNSLKSGIYFIKLNSVAETAIRKIFIRSGN